MNLSDAAKRRISTAARIAVTSLLLWLLARSLDFQVLKNVFREVALRWIVLACGTILVARFLIALRWKILLTVHGLSVPLWSLNKTIFISMFVGQFLPGVVGTDVVRGYKVAKSHGRGGTVAMTLVVDRVVGVYGMALVALIGAAIAAAAGRPTGLLLVVSGFLAALIVGGAAAIFVVRRMRARPMAGETRWGKWRNKATTVADTAIELARHPGAALAVLVVSVAIVLVRCSIFFFLYLGFATPVPFDALMVFIPGMFVAVLIPISMGGLGVREVVLVYFFTTIGVPAEVSVSVGLMFHFLQIVASSPGLVFWWTERRPSETEQPAAALTEEP